MIFLQFVIILQIDIPPHLLSFISKISKEEYFPGKIACLSHLVAIENIKKKLTEPQLEMFRKSCFGHFLLLPELRFSAQIVHQLLLRQCETKKDNEIWILLKSKGLRFSKEEFALITGLSFGPITKCDKKSLRIRDTYFKGENKVRNDELEKVFLSLGEEKKKKKNKKNKKKGFEDEEVIKLALLYFLEHVLFGKEGKNLIDMEWVALVDNLEAFNKYPWGGGFVMRGHYLVCKELWRTGYPNTKIKRKQREKLQLKHIVLLDFHMHSRFGHTRLFHLLD